MGVHTIVNAARVGACATSSGAPGYRWGPQLTAVSKVAFVYSNKGVPDSQLWTV